MYMLTGEPTPVHESFDFYMGRIERISLGRLEPSHFQKWGGCMLILPFEPSHVLQNFDRFTVKHAL